MASFGAGAGAGAGAGQVQVLEQVQGGLEQALELVQVPEQVRALEQALVPEQVQVQVLELEPVQVLERVQVRAQVDASQPVPKPDRVRAAVITPRHGTCASDHGRSTSRRTMPATQPYPFFEIVNPYNTDNFLEWTTDDWDPALRFWTLHLRPAAHRVAQIGRSISHLHHGGPGIRRASAGSLAVRAQTLLAKGWLEPRILHGSPIRR